MKRNWTSPLSRLCALGRAASGVLALAGLMAAPAGASETSTLTIFAAASMSESVDALSARYEADHGTRVSGIYSASSALARQIEHGAPADLFISANAVWMDYLAERNLIAPGTRGILATNHLIVVTRMPVAAPLDGKDGAALLAALRGRRLAMGEPTSVPAGIYAAQSLRTLGLFEALAPDMVFAENVRAALAWVMRGEAEFAIVYESDLRFSDELHRLTTFPDDSHDPIVYPVAALRGHAEPAAGFLAFLKTATARDILTAHGFGVPPLATSDETLDGGTAAP